MRVIFRQPSSLQLNIISKALCGILTTLSLSSCGGKTVAWPYPESTDLGYSTVIDRKEVASQGDRPIVDPVQQGSAAAQIGTAIAAGMLEHHNEQTASQKRFEYTLRQRDGSQNTIQSVSPISPPQCVAVTLEGVFKVAVLEKVQPDKCNS